APLSSDEVVISASVEDDVQVITPVPEDAPAPDFHHYRQGRPSATWTYRDRVERVLGHVARFDSGTDKQILPLTWCRFPDGRHGWRWHAFARPRPLYGLDRLSAHPDRAVLVVEG